MEGLKVVAIACDAPQTSWCALIFEGERRF
jgi:hypothetical protein